MRDPLRDRGTARPTGRPPPGGSGEARLFVVVITRALVTWLVVDSEAGRWGDVVAEQGCGGQGRRDKQLEPSCNNDPEAAKVLSVLSWAVRRTANQLACRLIHATGSGGETK